jgi:DNA-binding GntR family transcriptional regulator
MPRAKTKVYRVVRTNLNAQVYDILKEMIADRRFAPGSSLNVERLTAELGVSRTPIWEAIRRLEQEGIVFHTPHKGVRLVELTRKMAIELYEVRETMEAMAARLGAEQASPEIIARMEKILAEQKLIVKREDDVAYSRSDHDFHLLIYEACGNNLLTEILEGLRYKALPLAFKLSPHYGEFLKFHQQILEDFRNRDSRAAEKTMQRHNRRMLEIIRNTPWGVDGEEEIH